MSENVCQACLCCDRSSVAPVTGTAAQAQLEELNIQLIENVPGSPSLCTNCTSQVAAYHSFMVQLTQNQALLRAKYTVPDNGENTQVPNNFMPKITGVKSINGEAWSNPEENCYDDDDDAKSDVIDIHIEPVAYRREVSTEHWMSRVPGLTDIESRPAARVNGEQVTVYDTEPNNSNMDIHQHELTEDVNEHNFTYEVKAERLESAPTDLSAPPVAAASAAPSMTKNEYEHWKRCVLLTYNRMRWLKYASYFFHPVTERIAPYYNTVIKQPMDLGTIRRNIREGKIMTTGEFKRDVLLMISNALVYNDHASAMHFMTQEFLKEVNDQLDLLTDSLDGDKDMLPEPRPKRHLAASRMGEIKKRRETIEAHKYRRSSAQNTSLKIKRRRQTTAAGLLPQAPSRSSMRRKSVTERYQSEPFTTKSRRKSTALRRLSTMDLATRFRGGEA